MLSRWMVSKIVSVDGTRYSYRRRSRDSWAICLPTAPGTVGSVTWANADREMTPEGRMGMSNMWAWDELEQPVAFPETPWALDLNMADFPYPRDHHGQWFWESGFDKDAIGDAEGIRDWNLARRLRCLQRDEEP